MLMIFDVEFFTDEMKKIVLTGSRELQIITVTAVFVCAAPVNTEETISLEKVVVTEKNPPGNGLISPQDSTQARSVISRSALEQENSLNNVYQAMDLMPGVNT